jgi:hypothetical protein
MKHPSVSDKMHLGGKIMRVSLKILQLVLICILGLAPGVYANKLICVSKESLRGEENINKCLGDRGRFALMESDGSVHIKSDEEIALMKKFNPGAFNQPAYGTTYHREAPEIPRITPLR